jgi:predicted ArsR family transcriptional regulator
LTQVKQNFEDVAELVDQQQTAAVAQKRYRTKISQVRAAIACESSPQTLRVLNPVGNMNVQRCNPVAAANQQDFSHRTLA